MRNIRIVVQWRLTCDLNTLWQRFGRAARDPSLDAVAILFVEGKYFDDEKDKRTRAQKRKAEQELERQRKKARTGTASEPSDQRARTGHAAQQASDASSQVPLSTGDGVETGPETSAVNPSRGLSPECAPVDDATIAGAQACAPRLANVAALRADFQALYASTRAVQRGKKKAGKEDGLSPELDAFVNAATRPFKCYRAPIMAYYGNDLISRLVLALLVRVMTDYLL